MTKSIKPEMKKLNFLIGNWATQGIVKATNNSPEIKIKGTDTYEWILNKSFILHTIDVKMGKNKVQGIEIIGYDPTSKKYTMQSYDGEGVISNMSAKFDNDQNFVLTGNKMRATMIKKTGHSPMTAQWEQSSNNKKWKSWMEITFRPSK